MFWNVEFVCVSLCVCVTVTHSLSDRRRADGPRNRNAAAAGFNKPVRAVPSTQCRVSGILLFEGAVWSSDDCKVCECRDGVAQCHATPCQDPVSASPVMKPGGPRDKPVSRPKLGKKSRPANAKPTARTGPNTSAGPEKKKLPTKKNPEVTVRTRLWNQKAPVAPPPEAFPRPKVATRTKLDYDDHDDDDYVDDERDSDDDDDENYGVLIKTSHGPRGPAPRVDMVPIPRTRSLATQVPRPDGGVLSRVNRVRGRGRAVVSGRRSDHMTSLPASCLLSDAVIACGSAGLLSLPRIRDTGVRTLYLSDNEISKIPPRALHGLPNLEWLDLSKNKLDDASLGLYVFQNLTKLRRLNLDGNNLTKIPPLPPSLLELKINDNRLSGLTPHSFKGLSQLLNLELEDNHFHDGNVSPLAFRPLRKLIYLRLDDNEFRAIPSGLPASLKELHLSDNKIEVVHAGLLNKTLNLRVLNLSRNKIREDRIAPRAWIHLRKLETLDLSYNKLVHVPSFLPVGLLQLTLHHNQLERIPGYVFGHMQPGLVSLHLSHNRLREDGIGEVSFLGLRHSLNELLLDHNLLRAIPRGILQLRVLQALRLNHNYISSVPVNTLCDITAREDSPLLTVHLQNNLIERRLVPPTALTCIRDYSSVILQPQRHENIYE